jgi:chromosome segregation ATPase
MSDIQEVIDEAVEHAQGEKKEKPTSRLDSAIAICVAVVATFMAISNIKDGNIVQAMAQKQAKSVSTWSQYQAKSTKQNLAQSTKELAGLQHAAPDVLTHYDTEIARYEKEKEEIKAQAEGLEKDYDDLNVHDDQFDMAEACMTVAIALFGVTALTRKRWLFWFAFGLASMGVVLGLAGFIGWSFHPDWLAKLLG